MDHAKELDQNYQHKKYVGVIQKAVDNGYKLKDDLGVEEFASLAPPSFYLLDEEFASKAGYSRDELIEKIEQGDDYDAFIVAAGEA